MRLRTPLIGALAFAASASLAAVAFAADDGHTEHGAHQHGHGTLTMAIENTTVSLELRVPGNDILGFEHPPATDQEKKLVAEAKVKLADALGMFGIPKDAGCAVTETDVHMHGGDHDGDDDEKEAQKADTGAQPAHTHEHSAVHAKYTLTCRTPQAIKALDIALFAAFPGSQELDIVAVSEKGQAKVEATRKVPKVSLPGLW
ncbi:MAG: DUF2796 domain-containing protein [Hyphomicrobiales bacterium]|nr:MAG: DUF2796 domain-containing protein [Hyphomicrobiales bacterium]